LPLRNPDDGGLLLLLPLLLEEEEETTSNPQLFSMSTFPVLTVAAPPDDVSQPNL
mgnify:CR=1